MAQRHGEVGSGTWTHARWCGVHHSYHGILYSCPEYPAELLAELESARVKMIEKLRSDDSVQAGIMRTFLTLRELGEME